MTCIDFYIKVFGMAGAFGVCTYVGFYLAKRLKQRFTDLESIEKLVIALRGEINYKSTVLDEAFLCIKDKVDGSLLIYLEKIYEAMENSHGKSMMELAKDNKSILTPMALHKSDIEEFTSFVGNLGYLDKAMQLSVMDMYLEKLRISKEESKNEINRSSKMYKCMGAFIGIMVCILVA